MRAKTTNGFDRMTDAELEVKTQAIVLGMTNNTYFPNPVPTVEAVEITLTAFSNALSAAQSGNRMEIAKKNAERRNLIALLHQMGSYSPSLLTVCLSHRMLFL